MGRLMRFTSLLRRFGQDESGVFAVIFGLMAIVLVAMGGAVVDYVALEQTRNRAQIALDAAALALQPEINDVGVTETTLKERAQAIVIERIGDPSVVAEVQTATIDIPNGKLLLTGNFHMPTLFVKLVGVNQLSSRITAEAMQGSANLEISLALDVTGSMGGSRIAALKEAAKELVDVILELNQGETKASIALVPYSQAVNAASYATALRGPIRAAKQIASVVWASGAAKNITGGTNTTPVKITSQGHGFQNGDWVYIAGMNGITHINGRAWKVQNRSNNNFELAGSTSASNQGSSSNGSVTKCLEANCGLVVTSNAHGFVDDDYVLVSGVTGLTGLVNKSLLLQVSQASTNTLILNGLPAGGGGTHVPNSGKMDCTWQRATEGCPYYRFRNQAGSYVLDEITTCVTERAANPFNDQPPSATYVGRNYPTANDCPSSPIIPLTRDKPTLVNAINGLPATGTTAGSLGILWSWYMLSPNFGYVWPAGRRPEPYGTRDLLKAAIIMTDGEFNTVHYEGVLSRNSNIGNTSQRHENNAHNGAPYVQAKAYCDAMHAAKITVYTVGFDIGKGTPAANIMSYCASAPGNYYSAANADDLKEAFVQIARNIAALRLTK